jgi:hypothetical protein
VIGCIRIVQPSYSIPSPADRELFWHLLCSHAFNDQAQEFFLSGGQVIHGVRLASEWLNRLEFIWPVVILLNSRARQSETQTSLIRSKPRRKRF